MDLGARLGLAILTAALSTGCDEDFVPPDDGGGGGATDPFAAYPPAELSPGNVAAFASFSAPNLFTVAAVLFTIPELNGTPTCPAKTVSGNITTYEGGCVDDSGAEWVGSATSEETESGGMIVYQGFGTRKAELCQGASVTNAFSYTGDLTVTKTGDGQFDYLIDLAAEYSGADPDTCIEVDSHALYAYDGKVAGAPNTTGNLALDKQTSWSGSGRVAIAQLGVFSTRTDREIVDGAVCEGEALSGTTTLAAGADEAVITYDGATDCEMTSTVQWSLNGVAQGELSGIRCSAGAATHAPAGAAGGRDRGWLAALVAALALSASRRRQGRRRRP